MLYSRPYEPIAKCFQNIPNTRSSTGKFSFQTTFLSDTAAPKINISFCHVYFRYCCSKHTTTESTLAERKQQFFWSKMGYAYTRHWKFNEHKAHIIKTCKWFLCSTAQFLETFSSIFRTSSFAWGRLEELKV